MKEEEHERGIRAVGIDRSVNDEKKKRLCDGVKGDQ